MLPPPPPNTYRPTVGDAAARVQTSGSGHAQKFCPPPPKLTPMGLSWTWLLAVFEVAIQEIVVSARNKAVSDSGPEGVCVCTHACMQGKEANGNTCVVIVYQT